MTRPFILQAAMLLIVLTGCSDTRSSDVPDQTAVDQVTCYRDESLRSVPANKVYAQLMSTTKTRSLTWREHHDLAVCKAVMGDYAGAQAAFESAAAVVDREKATPDAVRRAKALSFISAAQCASLAKRPYDAAKLANLASECESDNDHIAAIRLGLWIAADDELEISAASEQVRRLNVNMDPKVQKKGLIGGIVMLCATSTYLGWQAYRHQAPPTPTEVLKCLNLIGVGFLLPPPL